MATNSVIIYQFADFNMEDFYTRYLYEINEHIVIESEVDYHPDYLIKCGVNLSNEQYNALLDRYNNPKQIYCKAKRGAEKYEIIKCKVQYLQHLIIRRAYYKKDTQVFSLNSQILKKIIGDEYSKMIYVLIQMGYLMHADGSHGFYVKGKYAKIYTIPDDCKITSIFSTNAKLLKYLKKESEQLELYRKTVVSPIIEEKFGKDFQKEYEISLSKIHLIDNLGFQSFVEQRLIEKPDGKLYYEYIREGLDEKNKRIQKVDGAGRIYHVLTNTKREIKQFLNIAISADCKNSHPVLFNYFIFKSHNISRNDAYSISLAMHGIDDASSIRASLSKVVSSNLLGSFKDDELKYIYETSTGQFWDNIVREFPEYNRTEVKEKMFAEVFYSNSHQVRGYQIFGRRFQKQFPNVMKLIKAWKKDENREWIDTYMSKHGLCSEKPEAAISIAMMNLEARIFTKILKRMYSKRWRAFHIHDCIIVPQTRGKNQPTREEVISIMMDEYKKYGLTPTFD